jgi:hypothetical protein
MQWWCSEARDFLINLVYQVGRPRRADGAKCESPAPQEPVPIPPDEPLAVTGERRPPRDSGPLAAQPRRLTSYRTETGPAQSARGYLPNTKPCIWPPAVVSREARFQSGLA